MESYPSCIGLELATNFFFSGDVTDYGELSSSMLDIVSRRRHVRHCDCGRREIFLRIANARRKEDDCVKMK